jgi:RNA polymerase sigma-70 factor (ECF subfamily)
VTNSPTPGLSEPILGSSFVGSDAETWLTALQSGGRAGAEAVFRLRSLLVAAARFEASRRRPDMSDLGNEELDNIVSEAADEALNSVLKSLEKCDGNRRFTTWARKFAVVETSVRLRRRAWHSRSLPSEGECWASASKDANHQGLRQLRRLSEEALGEPERRVLTALTLGHVPIDVIADRIGTTRGTVDQMVRNARAELSASLVGSEGRTE